MEYETNIYAEEVKKRLVEVTPKEHLKGSSHICKDLKYNFIDGKYPPEDFVVKYHEKASSLNSSQIMCINFFKKFFESDSYKTLLTDILRKCGLNIAEDAFIEKAEFEYRPDQYERTSLDFFLFMSDKQQISFEIKYTEPEFGGISEAKDNPDRYINSWNKNYARIIKNSLYFPSDLSCHKNCICTKGGILDGSCGKSGECGIYKFYENFQINRNILYAKKEDDIVVFLTPKENFYLNSGRKYIDAFARQRKTKNIVNLYWEDVIRKTLDLADGELKEYMIKFKDKYFSQPLSIPADVLTEKGFVRYVEQLARENISTLYKNAIVNFRGRTEDTHQLFTELICKWLTENISVFDGIEKIERKASYKTEDHDGNIADINSPRKEEVMAKIMFNQKKLGDNFELIDYQTPLKNKQDDEAGKIDLLAYGGTTAYILELKKPDSTETMLRCVMEGYTYRETIADRKKFLKDFILPEDTVIKACPFVALDGEQYKEMQQDRPYLKRLMDMLDIKPIYYSEKDGKYMI